MRTKLRIATTTCIEVNPRMAGSARGYWQATRAPRYSVLIALPLLLLYELLAVVVGPASGGLRNGADALLRGLAMSIGGRWAPVVLGAALLCAGAWLVGRDARRHGWKWNTRWFGLMLGESAVLALLFGVVVATATSQLLGVLPLAIYEAASPLAVQGGPLSHGWATWLMLSLGAGLYEELVFRVMLVGGIAALAPAVLGTSRRASLTIAVVVSAVLFSLAHYVGPYGDPLQLASFTFRFIAGLAFSALFALRGFGITAWTHALYDVYVGMI